jgi:haloalkane dehalogenase
MKLTAVVSLIFINIMVLNSQTPDWLDKEMYPFKSNYFDLDGVKMHYVDEGSGDPIIFLHGNPGWSFEYREIIKSLSSTNRCIAPDYIGFGLSDKPEYFSYLPEDHAKNLNRLLESLDLQNVTLVVNDWGGPIGLSYALANPERIKKLVILNTWLWPVENEKHYQKFSSFMGGFLGRFLVKNFNFFAKSFLKKVYGDPDKLTPEIHRHYYMPFKERKHRKPTYIFPREIIGSTDYLTRLWEQKDKIADIETVFIWGMKDIAFREKELNYWLDNMNNTRVIKLDSVGHFPQEEAPGVIIEELQQ